MLKRGQKVVVSGLGGRRQELIVWQPRPHGAGLCSEKGYKSLIKGEEAPIVGFPAKDIIDMSVTMSDQPTGE